MGNTKVIHIITKLELGGAQQNTLFTVAHLTRSKYEPVLISGAEGVLVEDARRLDDVKVYFIPELVREIRPIKDLVALFKIRSILKELKRDTEEEGLRTGAEIIVHTHCSKAGVLGRWAARFANSKIIIHSIHGFSFNDYQPSLVRAFYILLEKLTAKITTKFIAVSKGNIDKGIEKGIFTEGKVVLIRSGIEIEEFRSERHDRRKKRKELGCDEEIPLVAMIACLKPQKSPLDFVRVAKMVSDEIYEARFLLIGDGILRTRIEALIEKLHMDDKFILLGWRRDIPEIINCIDVLVLTSLWEGLPRVFPQAMASGIPIVATKVDGAPEAVRNDINGYLLPPGDIRGVSEKIIYLITHPEKAKEMGEKGKIFVKEFDVWEMMEKQEGLYSDLLK